MGQSFSAISDTHRRFIESQQMFFVATAPLDGAGHVNLSPKGLDTFRVLSANRVAYLDFVGSGNETGAHLLENGRITFMFCAYTGDPLILRLYGRGRALLPGSAGWDELIGAFPAFPGIRQIIDVQVTRVGTSCGSGVPVYEFVGQREKMIRWAEKMGQEKLAAFRRRHNRASIDALPTPEGLADSGV